jgi:hypothetical protein
MTSVVTGNLSTTLPTSNISFAPVTNNNFVSNGGTTLMSVPFDKKEVVLEEQATLDVKGRVRLNGEFLDERLERIETVLQIPTRDVTMETKHPKLAELYKAYMQELEKYKTWDRLKGNDDGTT